MTLQEAQARFSAIVQSVAVGMSPAELNTKHGDLQALLNALPNTAEFDPLTAAIAEFSPKLKGQVTAAVVLDLQSRDGAFREARALLDRVSAKANSDVRTLRFEQPKMIAAALTESTAMLKQIRDAAKAGDIAGTIAKTEGLAAMLEQIGALVKVEG